MKSNTLFSALFSCALLFSLSSAQTCRTSNFANSNNNLPSCVDLPVLNSFLHWNYNEAAGTVDIAFRHSGTTRSNWISWGLNPTGAAMAGTQAIVAFHNSSGQFQAYTTPLDSRPTLQPGNLSFGVSNIVATSNDNEAVIFATLALPANLVSTNQVWQVGPAPGGNPGVHLTTGVNMRSTGAINFSSGLTTTNDGAVNSRLRRRNIHGVLNAVSWGILMPIGAIMARYVKVFADPTWFYLHVGVQTSAYIIGVAGWATGLKLGSESPGFQYDKHRNIGITLFVFATLQAFAILLRPKPDHKYRLYWNVYHHSVGYATIILSIINVFEGFKILQLAEQWRWTYKGIIISLGVIAIILEAITWAIVLKRKKTASSKYEHQGYGNGNGNGNGASTQQMV